MNTYKGVVNMENYIWIVLANAISCLIINIIIFQFMKERFTYRLEKKIYYYILIVITTILIVCINMIGQPLLNIGSWFLIFGIYSSILFESDKVKIFQRIIETESMVVVLTIVEALGSVLMDYILIKLKLVDISIVTKTSLEVTFSKLVVMFVYYVFITKIWNKKESSVYSSIRLMLYAVLFIYSLLNVFVIVYSVSVLKSEEFNLLLLMNLGCIIFANMYFIYFIRYVEENSELKHKLQLLEQQADIQYQYYLEQEKKYRESLSILHDVDNHIRTIEDLYINKNVEDAVSYTKDISNLLKPLVPIRFTNSPILNILLKDKLNIAANNNIKCDTEIENVDLSFMEPIDVTTIFGNLLDNAIEAQLSLNENRRMVIKISSFHEMISIRIVNNSQEVKKWKNDRPVSSKGKNHGIGLLNVEKAVSQYDGSIKLGMEGKQFYCNILLNS